MKNFILLMNKNFIICVSINNSNASFGTQVLPIAWSVVDSFKSIRLYVSIYHIRKTSFLK